MPPMPDKIERKYIGTRVGFALTAVGSYFGTLAALAWYPDLPATDVLSTCTWLIGALSVAIVGDTARPSGMKAGAFGVTTAQRPVE